MNASIKKFVVAASLLAATCTFADSAEIVNVEGRGVGANKAEALKDAYRDAVERAVGMYVDAEQKMKNDELVEDQILTHSKAYIEKYDVVKEKTKPNGLVEIRINAEVKKSVLTKKLSDVMPKQTFALGDDAQNIHSRIVTKEKRNGDAAALLENVIGELNPVKQLMNLSLSPAKPIQAVDNDGKQKLYYRFKFTVNDRKYYDEFLPPLLKVLDQIALKQPKDVRLRAVDPSEGGFDASNLAEHKKEYIGGKWEKFDAAKDGHTKFSSRYYEGEATGVYVDDIGLADGKGNSWCVSMKNAQCGEAKEYYGNSATCKLVDDGVFHAMVITKMNESRSVVKAREYALPPECADVVLKWYQRVVTAEATVRYSERNPCKTTYNIVFLDKSGEEVSAMPVSFENRAVANVFLGHMPYLPKGADCNHQVALFVSPMVHCDAASLEEWIGFNIPRDELPNIKSVTVELAE